MRNFLIYERERERQRETERERESERETEREREYEESAIGKIFSMKTNGGPYEIYTISFVVNQNMPKKVFGK